MREKQLIENNYISQTSLADTKLYAVLAQFSVYDLNRLGKFVRSPYFNKNEDLTRLFEELNDSLRKRNGSNLKKRELWAKTTLNKPYNDLRFRKLCSDFLKLIERFLMQEVFEDNSLQQADNLLLAIYNRKLESLYNTSVNAAERLSTQYHFRPSSYYYYKYSFERNYYNLTSLEIDRSKQVNIDQIAENLDKFYVAEKLRCYFMMIDRQKMSSHDYHVLFMDEIITHIESGSLREIVPINLYYQIHLMQKESAVSDHFDKLKQLMATHINLLPQQEAYEVLASALNYCINKVNSGNNDYLREYMELSLMGIKKEILLINGTLDPWAFRNIVFAGLRLGDFTWVKDFIFGYQHHIDSQYRENAVSFNLGTLYFYQKKYEEVLKLLQSVEYEDPSYNRNSKIMLLLTYYELEETESLTSLLASFELYLRRNKSLPENRKAPYLNLIKFLRSLIRISNTDVKSLTKLRKKVDETESIVNKEWLLEKIDTLL